jgi:uncharacterized repeat protein (TIGR02543 family)
MEKMNKLLSGAMHIACVMVLVVVGVMTPKESVHGVSYSSKNTDVTYDGEYHELNADISAGDSTTYYSYRDEDSLEMVKTTVKPSFKKVGVHSVTVTTEGGNTKLNATVTVTIRPNIKMGTVNVEKYKMIFKVSWDAVSGADRYQVSFTKNESLKGGNLVTTPSTSFVPETTLYSIEDDTYYYVTVTPMAKSFCYDAADASVSEKYISGTESEVMKVKTEKKEPVTVTFDGNGGAASATSYTVTKGNTIGALPTASREDAIFLGWYDDKTGGTKINENLEVYSAATYYAHWKDKASVTFDCNGGWFTGWWTNNTQDKNYTSSQIDYSIGYVFQELPEAASTGYVFDGWYTNKTGGSKLQTPYKIQNDATYYAHWTAVDVSKAKVKTVAAGGETLSVEFAEVKGADGYEVLYATNKKMKKAKKIITEDTSVLLQKLKAGTQYYIKIRAYSIDSAGEKVYGAYSKVKAIQTNTVGLSIVKKKLLAGQGVSLKLKGASGTVKWSSSKKSVATVSSNGTVKAKKKGKTVITAQYGGKKYKSTISVEAPKLSKSKVSMTLGDTTTVKLNGTSFKTTYSSGNTKVVKIDNNGKITAVGTGSTKVKAKANGKTYVCKVTVAARKVTSQTVRCSTCGGTGTVSCGVCGGSGKISENRYDIYTKAYVQKQVSCNSCNSGKVTCPTCRGNKYLRQ